MFKFKNPFEKIMTPDKNNGGKIEELHRQYMESEIGQDELFKELPTKKVEEFVQYHNTFRESFDDSDTRASFKANQLSNIIEKGILEKSTHKAHGERYVERIN